MPCPSIPAIQALSVCRDANRNDFDGIILVCEVQFFSWFGAHQRPTQRGGKGEQACSGISLIIANDRNGTLAAVHLEGDRATKSDARTIGLVHQLGGRLPGAPVAQLAWGSFDRVFVSQSQQRGFQFGNAGSNLCQPPRGDQVRARRDRQFELRFEVFLVTFAAKSYANVQVSSGAIQSAMSRTRPINASPCAIEVSFPALADCYLFLRSG